MRRSRLFENSEERIHFSRNFVWNMCYGECAQRSKREKGRIGWGKRQQRERLKIEKDNDKRTERK